MRRSKPFRSGDDLPNTLSECLSLEHEIRCYCLKCTYHNVLHLEALILWKGPGYHLNPKRMRCSRCYNLGGDFRISHKWAGRKRPDKEEG